ncbi:MAG: hypothetical protein U5O39_02190 [Gammaproteobacteria bacterium]|nr:hypothetical protein [Gammaproteobacteria bacterium]
MPFALSKPTWLPTAIRNEFPAEWLPCPTPGTGWIELLNRHGTQGPGWRPCYAEPEADPDTGGSAALSAATSTSR